MTSNITASNPLLKTSPLPHRAVPFEQIKPEHFMPALEAAITDAKSRIEWIKSDKDVPTFVNTIEELECCSERVDWVANIFFNLLGAETNDELQALAQEFGPRLSNFSSDLVLDPQLFARVKAVYDQRASLKLDHEQKRLLDNTYSDFVRNGAQLSEAQKVRLREIDQRLAKLGPQYGENVLKATNEFELYLKTPEELAGLPDSAKEAARIAADSKGRPGEFLFTLQAPSYVAFMKFADHRPSRELMAKAMGSRAYGGVHDNQKIVCEIAQLRFERAALLGFASHAHFVLERRMAENPSRVQAFLSRLLKASRPAALKEVAEVQAFAVENGGPKQLQSWDFSYYAEKLREKVYSFNEEELRPYFKLENVVDGVFALASKLYSLEFVPTKKFPTYHPDVHVYEVYQDNNNTRDFMGLFYTDFFPRPSKRDGAWMTNYVEQGKFDGHVMRPHVSIVCNFTKPTPSKPSLLTLNEVRTLFHEFGHALHSILSRCHYRTLAGTNVYWDFVELPSQILENWTREAEGLNLFARHYETGAPLPKELTQKIKDSSLFLSGYHTIRQLNFAFLDMYWHSQDPSDIKDIARFEDEVTAETRLLPHIPGTCISSSFSHIFGGGYAAGYYGYKWAEVLDADAFELFLEKGLFNSDVARHFEDHILSRGGTEHPMELYKRFRGREPDPDALLRRSGLI